MHAYAACDEWLQDACRGDYGYLNSGRGLAQNSYFHAFSVTLMLGSPLTHQTAHCDWLVGPLDGRVWLGLMQVSSLTVKWL